VSELPAPAGGEIAPLLLPDPARLFGERAERLARLARGHAVAPFLELLARVASGQQVAAREVPMGGAPGLPGGRPLDRARWERDPSWRAMLRVVLAASRGGDLPAQAGAALDRLAHATEPELEERARAVLSDAPDDLAAAPFIGAALQVYFTRLAAGLDAGTVPPAPTDCPVCGSPPVAGVVLGDDRSRHLSCALCATRWHLPRIRCAACQASDAISYLALEGPPGVKAETCDRCRSYLKLIDLQDVPGAEPVADDAATIVLDLLMGERGYHRAGANLLAPGGEPA
jgi:FdhE protein